MAYSQKLIDWIRSEQKVKLKVYRMNWPNDFGLSWFDYCSEVCLDDRVYVGRGVDQNQQIAFSKSICEAIERCVVEYNNLKNTSGVAGHLCLGKAKKHAISELIERDSFFCHFLSQTPFRDLSFSSIEPKICDLISLLSQKGIKIDLKSMLVPNGYYGVLCIASGEGFGVCLGLGCNIDFKDTVFSAISEVVVNVAAYLKKQRQFKPLSLVEFSNIVKPSAVDHLRLGYGLDAKILLSQILGETRICEEERSTPLDIQTITVDEIETPYALKNAPFVYCQAKSRQAQAAYFGHFCETSINFNRISDFSGRELCSLSLPRYPHILG